MKLAAARWVAAVIAARQQELPVDEILSLRAPPRPSPPPLSPRCGMGFPLYSLFPLANVGMQSAESSND